MIVEVRDLWRTFGGVAAVAGVNFSLQPGELRCLIGANGAGKSTFFKLLSGQLKPSAGTIRIMGKDTSRYSPFEIARLGVGIKTQVPNLFNGLSVRVAAGDVPLSIGTDQAGSVRIPSSYCGAYGMKPTYGLVPYTGITPLEPSMDHAGPISANVRDNARLLQAIAGADGIDPRQRDVQVNDYAAELDRGVQGLRIGVVREGFGRANSEAGVDAKVREAAARFARMGAVVEEISIPMHSLGFAIWAPIAHDGGLWTMLETHGLGIGGLGPSAGSQPYFGARWREAGDDMADTIKIMALFGRYSIGRYHGSYYAKAQRMRARLRAAYDEALSRFDLLLMPTLPLKATPLPPQGAGPEEVTARSWEMIGNTCAFNVTGHPAMTLPCGMEDGRPIGVMLTGKHWSEPTIYGAAAAFEADGDWRTF